MSGDGVLKGAICPAMPHDVDVATSPHQSVRDVRCRRPPHRDVDRSSESVTTWGVVHARSSEHLCPFFETQPNLTQQF